MKKLILKASYGQNFTHEKLPRLFLKLIITEINKSTNIAVLTYIRDNYKITAKELNKLLKENISISNYADNVVIDFKNIKIKELENNEPIYLETLLNIIDYGNREIKGLGITNNIINYLQSQISTLYNLSKIRRNSVIWQ